MRPNAIGVRAPRDLEPAVVGLACTRPLAASTGCAGSGARGCGCAPRRRRSPGTAAAPRLRPSPRASCARLPRRTELRSRSSCLLWPRALRDRHSDARLGHEIAATRSRDVVGCRGGFCDDSPVAESPQRKTSPRCPKATRRGVCVQCERRDRGSAGARQVRFSDDGASRRGQPCPGARAHLARGRRTRSGRCRGTRSWRPPTQGSMPTRPRRRRRSR